MYPSAADIGALLERLNGAGVEFIVVGGAAMLLHGSGTSTRDLDVVPRQDPANLNRLHDLLVELNAVHREPGGRRLPVSRVALEGTGQLLLRTRLGPLDLLLRLHDGDGFEALSPESILMDAGVMKVRVLDLPRLIAIKGSTGRVRDQLAVPLLVALLEERERR